MRDFADADIKSLVERELMGAAHHHLGDFRNKILLSLPPENKARGEINLGTIQYEKEKWDFGISKDELLRNVGICGMSGSGKTNMAFHILKQLSEKRVPFLFWDWKRTGRHLIPKIKSPINMMMMLFACARILYCIKGKSGFDGSIGMKAPLTNVAIPTCFCFAH